ncbi:hypothetical protein HKX42_06700 [Salinisphaera sp. USBA-960]|nr:hypothetical protein [Salifodinibacter halophilus]NNC26563.1 hypothetical protein [Salifodinibacter halophilus]
MRIIDLTTLSAVSAGNGINTFIAAGAPVVIAGFDFGSQMSIEGPEPDQFIVTDESITLTFSVRGRYRLYIAAELGAVGTSRLLAVV